MYVVRMSGLKMLHPSLLDSLHLLKLTMLGVCIYLMGGRGRGEGAEGGILCERSELHTS